MLYYFTIVLFPCIYFISIIYSASCHFKTYIIIQRTVSMKNHEWKCKLDYKGTEIVI